MLRITDNMHLMRNTQDLADAQQMLFQRERQSSTGLRVHSASDDPTAAAQLTRLDADRAAAAQYQQNLARAVGELEMADSALATTSELLQKARDLALQLSNGVVSAQERLDGASEIDGIRDQIIALANSRHGNVYIFGGYLTADAPFDPTTGAYSGDTNQRQIQGDDNLMLDIGLDGETILNPAGGTDVLTVLDDLATALRNDDVDGPTGIVAQGALLGDAREQVVSARATIGGQLISVTDQEAIIDQRRLNTDADRARLVEADAVEALSGLAEAQQALNRMLQVTTNLLQKMTLVDRL